MIVNLEAKNKSGKNAKHNLVNRKLKHYSRIGIQYYGIYENVNKLSTDLYFNSFREVTKGLQNFFRHFLIDSTIEHYKSCGNHMTDIHKISHKGLCVPLSIDYEDHSIEQPIPQNIPFTILRWMWYTKSPHYQSSRITDPTILDLRFWTSISGPFLFQVHSNQLKILGKPKKKLHQETHIHC